jgi:hypothetical protein
MSCQSENQIIDFKITLYVYVIYSPNNPDNIFLNKDINRLLVDIFKSEYTVKYTDDFKQSNVILFAENVKLIKDFIDINNLMYKKCVAITQEVYHEQTEDTYQNYNENQIYIYNCFNKKFYLNHCYNFYGIPGGKIDICNKTKDNYSTELYYFGNIWRQNWEAKSTLYKKRLEFAIKGYKEKFISQIYSRDFYGISLNNVHPKNMELEKDILEIQQYVIKNVSMLEKRILTQKLFYSIEFLPTDYTNFTSERPFDAIISGCVPIFMGTNTLKEIFPNDSIIYVDEFSTPLDCFNYVKQLSFEQWKNRIDKCIDILFKLTKEGKTGLALIFNIFKNIVFDLFKDYKQVIPNLLIKQYEHYFFFPPKNCNHKFVFDLLTDDMLRKLKDLIIIEVLCDNCVVSLGIVDKRTELLHDNAPCVHCGNIQHINTNVVLNDKVRLSTIYDNKYNIGLGCNINNISINDILVISIRNIYTRAISIYLHCSKHGYIMNEIQFLNNNLAFEEWLELLIEKKQTNELFDRHYDNQTCMFDYFYILPCKIKYILIDDNDNSKNNILDFINHTSNFKMLENFSNHINYKKLTNDYEYCGNIKYSNLNYDNYMSFYNQKTKKIVEELYKRDFILLQNFDSIITFPFTINLA